MRTIEEIKADMEEAIEKYDTDRMNDLYKEEALYYIRDIQVDCLEQICNAEREGRVVVLPCKVGDTVWTIVPSIPYSLGTKELHETKFDLRLLHHNIKIYTDKAQAEAALREGK